MRTPMAAAILATCVTAASGQTCAPGWRARFYPLDYAIPDSHSYYSEIATSVVFDDDGPGPHRPALVVRGEFSSIGGVPANGIAKWDGQSWSPLGAGASGGYGSHAMVVFDPDGPGPQLAAVYVAQGGAVRQWNGATWTQVGSTPLDADALFVLDPDGPGPAPTTLYATKVVFEGNSTHGYYRGQLYALQGGAWSRLADIGTDRGAIVEMVTLDDDGPGPHGTQLYVATQLYECMYCGNSAGWPIYSWGLWRLDASGWTAIVNGPNNRIDGVAVFDAPGSPTPRLYAWGVRELSPFPPQITFLSGNQLVPTPDQPNGAIHSLRVVQIDGGPKRLFALGRFTQIGAVSAKSIAVYDGAAWSALGPGISLPTYSYFPVLTVTPFDDDGPGPRPTFLYAAGDFATAGFAQARNIARWDGLAWLPPGMFPDNTVHTLLADNEAPIPTLYLGGSFLSAGGVRSIGVARWNGVEFTAMTEGMNSHVDALARFNGEVYAAGKFTTAGGVSASRIARWTGSTWAPLGPGLDGNVAALAVYDDGSGPALVAAGSFTHAGPLAAPHLAKWNGQAWSALGTGLDGNVGALAVYQGDLYAGGSFTAPGGADPATLARWNATGWHAVPATPPTPVSALAVHRGVLYAGCGSGSTSPSALVSAWNGQNWYTLPALTGSSGLPLRLTALTSFDEDGPGPGQPVLYASGDFDHAGSVAASHLARWDGLAWSQPAGGLSAPALSFAPFGAASGLPTLYAGGEFLLAGPPLQSWYLTSLTGCPTACEANCDGSATPPILNVLDLTCFLQRFSAGDPYANCDSSTAPPTLNVLDFTCFLQKFAAGCP